jgi:hypothetical protein
MIIPIEGYAPDLDTTTPGILTNCANLIPSLKGFKGAPSALSVGVAALASTCQGAAVLVKLDDTNRLIAGSGTKLYELSGTSWNDVTRVSGGDYGLGGDVRWCFAQFGNVSLAVAKSDILQGSVSGAFSDVGASVPKASIVETVGQFVFLFDINDQGSIGPFGDDPQRWWCCAIGDYTDWTPSISNQCASGQLTSSPGPVKAARRFGDSIVVYKEKSMFLGVYVGPPQTWEFREIPGASGALGQYAVVDVGTSEDPKHLFMGNDDFYQFDGSRPVRIGTPVREAVYSELNRSLASLSIALHDKTQSLVYFYYCSSSNTNPDKCVVYNYKTNKWGRDDRTIEMVVNYVSAGINYDTLGNFYSNYDDLPNISYDSSFFTAATPIPAVFNTSHTLNTLNGPSVSSSMTTGDFGDENSSVFLSRVSPRFLTKPSAANMVNFHRRTLGDSLTTDMTTAMDSKARFDLRREDFWHRVRFDFTGPVELAAINTNGSAGGME